MKFELSKDNILDAVGTAAAGYLAYSWAGGPPIPVLAQFVPWIAAVSVGLVTWRLVRK